MKGRLKNTVEETLKQHYDEQTLLHNLLIHALTWIIPKNENLKEKVLEK